MFKYIYIRECFQLTKLKLTSPSSTSIFLITYTYFSLSLFVSLCILVGNTLSGASSCCENSEKNTFVVQSLSYVRLIEIPLIAACQASLSFTVSRSFLKLVSVMPSNHLILCPPLLLLPSVFPSIRVFSNESAFCIRWPKHWSFSFSISPSNDYSGLISIKD